MMISDFTEFATKLYFCADASALRTRASTDVRWLGSRRHTDAGLEEEPGEQFRPVELDELVPWSGTRRRAASA